MCLHNMHIQFSWSLSRVWLCDARERSTPGLPVHHQLPKLAQTPVHWVSDAIQPSNPLSSPFLLLPSIFPSIRVFSNESSLHIRWLKYWRFSFSISPSNEYSGLISFRIDWFDLLAVQNPGLPHCRQILNHWTTRESPHLPLLLFLKTLPVNPKRN